LLDRLTRDIRELINTPEVENILTQNTPEWNQFCSSLDTIQDTDIAIDSYKKMKFPKDMGRRYINLYGLLQALFVQQNAVETLCESIGITFCANDISDLHYVRDIRNKSTGHPTKRGKKNYFLVRIEISKDRFVLQSDYDEEVSIPDLISKQRKFLESPLLRVIDKLNDTYNSKSN